jgi:hypothetical protein
MALSAFWGGSACHFLTWLKIVDGRKQIREGAALRKWERPFDGDCETVLWPKIIQGLSVK